jgi:membrane-associated phospholipid phosphatase
MDTWTCGSRMRRWCSQSLVGGAPGLLAATIAVLTACSDQQTAPTAVLAQNAGITRAPSLRAATATLSWQAETRSQVAAHRLNASTATRVYALVAVAQYGALVSLDEDGHTDDVLGSQPDVNGYGTGGRSRFEAERGAVAAASAQVLSFLFPDAAASLEQRVTDEGAAGDGEPHPQFTRGVDAGRAFGDVMIAWAKSDHFNDVWTGTVPKGPGKWIPNGAPVGPLMGLVRPYVMTSGDEFRPAPPPEFGSDAFEAALAEVRSISDTRTATQRAIAVKWALGAGTITALGLWDELAAEYIQEHALGERDAAHVIALANAAAMDAQIGCWDAKYTYWFIRPPQADPKITLAIPMPNHPSYPSGHSCSSSAAATVLAAFFPEHAAELDAMVEEAGVSRIYGGIHYRFDIDAGQALGSSVGQLALEVDRERGLLSHVR